MPRSQQTTASAARRDDCISDEYGLSPRALFVAFELGFSLWKLAFATQRGEKPRRRSVDARDLSALEQELQRAKARFKLPADAAVYSCYEAGRDGFWLHRYLASRGIENVVVDSAT